MEFLDVKIPKTCILRLGGDLQIGSVTFAGSRFNSAQEAVKNFFKPASKEPETYRFGFVGDIIDGFHHNHKNFSLEDWDPDYPEPMTQAEAFVDLVKLNGAEDLVEWVNIGNHELYGRAHGDVTRSIICKQLRAKYAGYMALIRFNKKGRIVSWHGRPSIRSSLTDPVARQMAILRRLYVVNHNLWAKNDCDGIFQGHVNALGVLPPTFSRIPELAYNWDAKKIHASYAAGDHRWFGLTGSLQTRTVKGKSPYTEAHGYSPLPLGCLDLYLEDGVLTNVKEVLL